MDNTNVQDSKNNSEEDPVGVILTAITVVCEYPPGVCGLVNLGNTCFMGAGLQALIATPPIAKYLIDLNPYNNFMKNAASSSQNMNCTLTSDLASLARLMWSGQYKYVKPEMFKTTLGKRFPQFDDYRQHDCQEFLALLLDGLHEQMNIANNPSTSFDKSIIKEKELATNIVNFCKFDNTKQTNLLLETAVVKENEINSNTNSELNNSNVRNKKIIPSNISDIVLNNNSSCSLQLEVAGGDNNGTAAALCVVKNVVKSSINDLFKVAKTSNVNVNAKQDEPNNEIRFDSQKYPRKDNIRKKQSFNLNLLHSSIKVNEANNASNSKRRNGLINDNEVKEGVENQFGLDLKRVKLNENDDENSHCQNVISLKSQKNSVLEVERNSISFDDVGLIEKNERLECERKAEEKNRRENDTLPTIAEEDDLERNEDMDKMPDDDGEKQWQQHLEKNHSVIVNTFQGQFKNTVVCSMCNYISLTYEPFMYLSVPLPKASKKQMHVSFISKCIKKIKLLVELKSNDCVKNLKETVLTMLNLDNTLKINSVVVAEVLDNHIARLVDDNLSVQSLNDNLRSICIFEVINLANKENENIMENDSNLPEEDCAICLDSKQGILHQHKGCSFVICETCIKDSLHHYCKNGQFKCPICKECICMENLQPKSSTDNIRLLNIPLIFRMDPDSVCDSTKKIKFNIFDHPLIIRIPNICTGQWIRDRLIKIIPYADIPFQILLVTGQGTSCSRCLYNVHCIGCPLSNDELMLYNSDNLAVVFNEDMSLDVQPLIESNVIKHSSMNWKQDISSKRITLYDCINAFSQSEELDEQNPWFCPKCKKNQKATKTLSIWRFPDYLIVYLKRFVFHGDYSTKIDEKVFYQIQGLTLGKGLVYDLYACICHIGGVWCGHYTSYALNCFTQEWNHFNDCYVSKKAPLEDFSTAYILFYKKRDIVNPLKLSEILTVNKDIPTE